MAERMGLSMSYIHQLEAGKRTPSDQVEKLVRIFEIQLESNPGSEKQPVRYPEELLGPPPAPRRFREIPVLGWAHAGEAATYEEMAEDWQDRIPTEARDPRAFAVILEGESMEPKFSPGDLLILQPSEEAYSGCLAVCRFKDDGVVFRRVEFAPEGVRLIALNPAYPTSIYAKESFSWIYPLWGRWTQVWR